MVQGSAAVDMEEEYRVRYAVRITPRLVLAILGPYVYEKLRQQIVAVVPIAAFLFLFQLVVIRQSVQGGLGIAAGLTCVILGLMFFMEGLRLGLMPLGENIGATLPAKARLWLILPFAFVLGVGATLAEPAIGTLKTAGSHVNPQEALLLSEMLGRSSGLLVASVGVGVGIATALGVYRLVANWSLKLLIIPTLAVVVPLTVVAELNPSTREVISLAWDTGAVTTGPVTVPLVLSLGLGVSAVLGRSDTGMSGFGVVTLASLWPIAMVLSLSLAIFYSGNYQSAQEVAQLAGSAAGPIAPGPSLVELFAASMQGAAQAVIPLVLLLYLVQRFILREQLRNLDQVLVGVVFALLGLVLFNLGLSSGLIPLGQQVGGNVPSAFAPPQQLYGETGGRAIALLFAFALGYGATLAEPALNALGITVEEVTAGAFKKSFLMHAVALGVSLGLALGIARIMFDWRITYMLIPSYLLLVLVTLVSEERFVNIGWDSAGVTTGPITVPLVLALGIGIGLAVGVPEGFGMLAMASVGPILTVLVAGLIVSRTSSRAVAASGPATATVAE